MTNALFVLLIVYSWHETARRKRLFARSQCQPPTDKDNAIILFCLYGIVFVALLFFDGIVGTHIIRAGIRNGIERSSIKIARQQVSYQLSK
jgi:hypothetical protein